MKFKKYLTVRCILLIVFSYLFTHSLNAQITVNISNKTIKEAIDIIEKQEIYSFFYNDRLPNLDKKISVNSNNEKIESVLDRLFRDTDISYKIESNNQIVLGKKGSTLSIKQIEGIVKDNKGIPLVGVTVTTEDHTKGTITDIDGNFTLNVSLGTVIKFSYLGFETKTIKVDDRTIYNIELAEDPRSLEEVIVVGYNTVKKRDLTTAVVSVSTEDIEERPITSAGQALQGKAAGVQVIQPSGKPGAGLSVRVRGATSVTAGNDPLYVVDGFPNGDISNLNPNDIESMQILKDASSAAIYGARAANGVVVITTKRGATGAKGGKPTINFSSYMGFSQLGKKIDALNTEDYKDLMTELSKVSDGIPNVANMGDNYTNWTDTYFGTGTNQNYQLSVSNATDNIQYFVSAGYMKEKGIEGKAKFQRYSFRSNIDNNFTNWLKMSLNFSYSHTGSRDVYESRSAFRAGSILAVINTPPFMQVWDPNKPTQYHENALGAQISNPVASNAADQDYKTDRLIGSLAFNVDLYKGLKYKINFGIDLTNSKYNYYLDPLSSADGRSVKGRVTEDNGRNFEWIFENILTYDTSIKKHNISILGGSILQRARGDDNGVTGFDLLTDYPNIRSINAANQIDPASVWSSSSQWSLASFIGSVMYNFDSKYLFTSNIRFDGSSRFAPGHRWGIFPSFSAGWRISDENFMEATRDVINDLKLRAGWGMTGNQSGIGNYPYLGRYEMKRVPVDLTQENPNLYPGMSIQQTTMANADLTWEKTTQTNIGLDFDLFNSRIRFTADAYYKKTKDLLFDISIPSSNIPNAITRNGGEMENKGLEFELSTKNLTGQFKWNTDFNISFNKNKLTKLNLTPVYYFAEMYTTGEAAIILKEGYELGTFFGFKSLGVDPETGDIVYADLDDNGIINSDDRTVLGTAQPKFTYGMTNTFSYKGFDLSIFLQGSYGNKIFNASKIDMEGMIDFRNQSTKVLDRWRRPGMITDIPRVGNIENIHNSDRFIEDGSYLRVKNITFSYNFPRQWLKKIHLSKLQPYITMQNLLTLTSYRGYDPEVNAAGNNSVYLGVDYGTYPQSKAFIFGLNIEF